MVDSGGLVGVVGSVHLLQQPVRHLRPQLRNRRPLPQVVVRQQGVGRACGRVLRPALLSAPRRPGRDHRNVSHRHCRIQRSRHRLARLDRLPNKVRTNVFLQTMHFLELAVLLGLQRFQPSASVPMQTQRGTLASYPAQVCSVPRLQRNHGAVVLGLPDWARPQRVHLRQRRRARRQPRRDRNQVVADTLDVTPPTATHIPAQFGGSGFLIRVCLVVRAQPGGVWCGRLRVWADWACRCELCFCQTAGQNLAAIINGRGQIRNSLHNGACGLIPMVIAYRFVCDLSRMLRHPGYALRLSAAARGACLG